MRFFKLIAKRQIIEIQYFVYMSLFLDDICIIANKNVKSCIKKIPKNTQKIY